MKKIKGLILCLFISSTLALPVLSSSKQATISNIYNRVEAKRFLGNWQQAFLNMPLFQGDKIRTGSNSKAQIVYVNGTITRIGSQSILTIQGNQINLYKGKIYLKVKKSTGGLKVKTPNAVAAVLGTEFLVDTTADLTNITVLEGKVHIENELENLILEGGFRSSIQSNKDISDPIPIDVNNFNDELLNEIENQTTIENVEDELPQDDNSDIIKAKLKSAPLSSDNTIRHTIEKTKTTDKLNTSPTTGELEIIIK